MGSLGGTGGSAAGNAGSDELDAPVDSAPIWERSAPDVPENSAPIWERVAPVVGLLPMPAPPLRGILGF